MSNNLKKSILVDLVNKYESGELLPEELESKVGHVINSLENTPIRIVHRFRDLTFHIVRSHFADDDQEFLDSKRNKSAVNDLRAAIELIAD